MLRFVIAFSVRRRRLVLAVAGVLLALMATLAPSAFGALKDGGFDDPSSASSRAAAIIDQHFRGDVNLVLLVTPVAAHSVDAPAVVAFGTRIARDLGTRSGVNGVESYWTNGYSSLRAPDRSSALIVMRVKGTDAQRASRAQAIIAEYANASSVATIRAGGALGTGQDLLSQIGVSLALAEGIAVPLTLLLLIFVFGNVIAALLPLIIGSFAVLGTFAELAILGRITDVSVYAINLTTALGLGLAVDYSLLIVNRFREELQKGSEVEQAIVRAGQTAGRTILFSSAIVTTALAALLIFPVYFLRSFALAGIGVVVISMATSVAVLPALLAILGRRLVRGRLLATDLSSGSPFWRRTAQRVTARPLAVGLPIVAIMLIIGSPLLTAHFGTPDDRVLRTSEASRQVGDVLRAHYAIAAGSPIDVIVEGEPRADDLVKYVHRLASLSDSTSDPTVVTDHGYVNVTIQGQGESASASNRSRVTTIRALSPPTGTTAYVGGPTAVLIDSEAAITRSLPWALLWIAISTATLLFLFTGSVLLPIKALLLNVVSLSAVFGLVVLIFQDGAFAGLLQFTPAPLNASILVLLFCVAFGLSMDYEVFLLARIKEAHDGGASTIDAVADGLARTGRIVTAAAALLAVTFFAFATARISFLQMFGVGTGIAVLLDATVVRGLLVPAFMAVAGEANWWAPRPLRRLHARFGITD